MHHGAADTLHVGHRGLVGAGEGVALPGECGIGDRACPKLVEVPSRAGDEPVQLRFAYSTGAPPYFELLESQSADSPIAAFLEKRGPGIHHVALQVDDIEAERDRLSAAGLEPLTAEPFIGANGKKVLFFHPRTTGGILLEICQVVEEE